MSDFVQPHRRQPTRLPRPWDSPSKNTGVGCHFLLQCMKAKSESEVAQSCLTPSDPMDCSLPGSSVHGIFQARVLEWVAIAFSVYQYRYIYVCVCMCLCAKLLQSCLTLCDPMDCSLPGYSVHGDSPSKNTGVGCHFLLQGIFPAQGLNPFPLRLPALAGGFFTTGTTWEAHIYVYKDSKIHIHIDFYIHMYLYTHKNKYCIYVYIKFGT